MFKILVFIQKQPIEPIELIKRLKLSSINPIQPIKLIHPIQHIQHIQHIHPIHPIYQYPIASFILNQNSLSKLDGPNVTFPAASPNRTATIFREGTT